MKVGRMYQVAGLAQLKRNDGLFINAYGNGDTPIMETGETGWYTGSRRAYVDGEVMVCVGKEERRTGHYEPQTFYKVLTLDGKTALISKATRKYFKPVKSNLCEREHKEASP